MITRKSKGIYRKWKEEDLQRALGAVKDGVGVNEYVHVISDCNEAEGETRVVTVDGARSVAGRYGFPKGCNYGNGYERFQD
jgi:hypothetical protein